MRASDPHPKTLLLIDDDAISRELLALLLEGEGFAVLVCDSGKAALEHQRTVGLHYIALTDLHMPGISGAELAAALSSARAKGAVLLAMSASQPGEGIAETFDGFLLKPFSAQGELRIKFNRSRDGKPYWKVFNLPGSGRVTGYTEVIG
jgi:CheY-like chemotaxis protein